MNPKEADKQIKRLHAYIFILTVSVLTLVWVLFKDQLRLTKKEQEVTQQTQFKKLKGEDKGNMTLVMKNNQRKIPANVPFTVQVIADSQSEDIVGFDVLVAYDKEAFKEVSASSPLSGFRVFDTQRDGYLAVTAIQDPQNSTRNVFKDQVILEVTLNPALAGEYDLTILSSKKAETSKLVSTETKVFFPKVEGLTVEIE